MADWLKLPPTPRLWLDAATGVTTVSGKVNKWVCRASNSWLYFVQDTDASRPSLITNALNGLPIVRFNGSSHRLIGPGATWSGDATVLFVAKSTTATGYLFWDGSITSDNAFHFGWSSSRPTLFGNGWNNQVPRALSGVNALNSYLLCSGVLSTTTSGIWVNGITPAGSTSATGQLIQTANATCHIGYDNYWSFSGDIAEIVIYPRALTAAERQEAEGYLAHKWGITLDASHPYVSTAATLSGTVLVSGNGGADQVVIRKADTRELMAIEVPDPATGAWSALVPEGDYDISYFAPDCQPICHGPYTVALS